MTSIITLGLLLAILTICTHAQNPKRLQIPGAIPIGPGGGGGGLERPLPYRRLIQQPVRRPIPNALPAPLPAIRPVVEEQEEHQSSISSISEEVARFSQLPTPSSTPRQQLYEEDDEEDEPVLKPYSPPVQFRPERPAIQQVQQPIRQAPPPVRQAQPVRAQQVRATARPQPRPQYIEDDDNTPRRQRTKKPPVQILRKYREDHPDGSITWGFENDDGTFKEENIGIDCVTRGKYGYIDPDGNRREYTYETGLKCDEPDQEIPEEVLLAQHVPSKQYKRPQQPQQGRLQ